MKAAKFSYLPLRVLHLKRIPLSNALLETLYSLALPLSDASIQLQKCVLDYSRNGIAWFSTLTSGWSHSWLLARARLWGEGLCPFHLPRWVHGSL